MSAFSPCPGRKGLTAKLKIQVNFLESIDSPWPQVVIANVEDVCYLGSMKTAATILTAFRQVGRLLGSIA